MEGPADPDNQRPLKESRLASSFSNRIDPSFFLISCLLSPFFFSVTMTPSSSPERCYCELWLRTQEGHFLVTRCLPQMPLQGDLVASAVSSGVSPVNMC